MSNDTTMTDPTLTAFLALTSHGYGWGDTQAEAERNCRGAASGDTIRKHGIITYRVHPKAELSLIDGGISSPVGHPPVKVADSRAVKWQKVQGKAYRATLIAREVLLIHQPEPMNMWQVIERGKLIGGIGNVDLKDAKAYTERLLKGL